MKVFRYVVFYLALILLAGCQPLEPALLPLQAEPGGPQVIGRTPLPGERLSLQPLIQIRFDRDMHPAETEAAWRLVDAQERPVEGAFTWVDETTFQFEPSRPLQAGAAYTGILAPVAALDGTLTAGELRFEYLTVDALAVSQVFPGESVEEIDVDSAITVIFNKPVAPLSILEDRGDLPDPIQITPRVSGQGEWINSSVYVFKPEPALVSGSTYSVQVPAGLVDLTGSQLEQAHTWTFRTAAPQVTHYSLVNGDRNPTNLVRHVLLDQAFEIGFTQPMNKEVVAASLHLSRAGVDFPLDLTWNEAATLVTIKPKERLEISETEYKLELDFALAADGGQLEKGISLRFYTVPLPHILGTQPSNASKASEYSSRMTINFSSPMDPHSLEGRIQVTPQPEGLSTFYSAYGWNLTVNGLQPSTEYTVKVLPGAQDIYGNRIEDEREVHFITGARKPYARMLLPYRPLVYREQGVQELYFQYTNATDINISIYELTYEEFSKYVQENSNAWRPTDFRPVERIPVLSWSPEDEPAPDAVRRVRLDFAGREGPLKAGYYLVGLQAEPFKSGEYFLQAAVFVVASDNLTFKATENEALAWLVDLETGKPVRGVPVTAYNRSMTKLKTVTTDKDGLAYFDDVIEPAFLRAEGSGRVAFAARSWGSGMSFGEFGVWTQYYGDVSGPFAYVYTDRPLYRPGQEVMFKGIVREQDDLHYSLPPAQEIFVTILNSEGEEVYKEALPISEMGSFNAQFEIAADAMLGTYDLYAGYSYDDAFAAVSFRVAEYRKPEFEVTVSAQETDVLAGDPFTFDLDAAYYSGGSVDGAEVEWFTEASLYGFVPTAEYSMFSFSNLSSSWYEYNASQPSGGTLNEGAGQTDSQGRFSVEQPSSLGEEGLSRRVTFSANVTDVAGNLVSGGSSVVVHQSLVYAGIRSLKYLGEVDKPQTFEVVALDWESLPQAGATVSVEVFRQQWFSVQKQDEDGKVTWETSLKETLVQQNAVIVLDANGLAQVQFTPAEGGIYKVVVTVSDDLGHTHQAAARIWVSSRYYVPWRQTNDRSFDLVADKSQYAPGDTAKILIASPFEEAVYALVTYERGHVYEREVILLEGNSTLYELPISKDMAPGVYLSVTVIRGAEQGGLDFKMGVTQLKVDTSQQELTVTITPDRETAGPGDEVTYTVETKDASGQPVSAEVSLALVDKALLALAPSNTLPILDAFYPQRALSVQTAVGIVQNAEDFNANYEGTETDGLAMGSGGGGKGVGDLGVIDVRQNFKDTAYFRAVVQTDENGQASVTVSLPDNLTTWRMDARAVTGDSLVGQATHELVSAKPVFIQIQAPRFFVVGDSVQLGAAVHNNTDADMQVTVSLDAQGVTMRSEKLRVLDVPARSQAYVTWDVEVKPGSERVDLLASAVGGGYEDSTRPTLGTLEDNGIPVYAYHAREAVGTGGILMDAGSASELVVLPRAFETSRAELVVELSPSLAASMTDGLAYLRDYPHLCMEQTVSRFLPNVLSARALKLAGIDSPLQADLDVNVNLALQRIYANQISNGGWGWWSSQESQPLTTAYVLLGLVEARDSGYTVSEDVIERGLDYLHSRLSLLHANASTSDFNRQAFIVYVLARAGQPHTSQMNFLFKHQTKLDVYAQAYLTHAMFLADPADERIQSLLSNFHGAAITSATGTHWQEEAPDYWNWNTDKRTTAIVLHMLTDVDPENPLTANAVRWVMSNRRGGRFDSTQETAWTLMALTNWLKVTGELDGSYSYALGLNGELLQQASATKENLSDPLVVRQALVEEINTLVIVRGEGAGNLYYSAYLDLTLPADQVGALDHGIMVSRQYYALTDLKTPITATQRGELAQVRVTIVVPESLHYVVVEDPLPAGFEAVDSSLNTSAEVPKSLSGEALQLRGWGWWYFDHIGMYDEKVVLSADYLPAGTYVFTYLARASTAGTFQVMPVTAQEFYFPDVMGRGAGSIFVVRP
ncbi:MAG: Ig-like domain-containing protein [Chloroflexota bacterium]